MSVATRHRLTRPALIALTLAAWSVPPAPRAPWSAGLAAAQDATRAKGKRKHDAASAKTPAVEVLSPTLTPAQAQARARARVEIVMYSAAWCGVCDVARAYFQQHGIAFVERDVEHDAAARAQHRALSPTGSLPTIEVDGQVMHGFSASSFEKLMDKATQHRLQHPDSSGPKTFEVRWDGSSRRVVTD